MEASGVIVQKRLRHAVWPRGCRGQMGGDINGSGCPAMERGIRQTARVWVFNEHPVKAM